MTDVIVHGKLKDKVKHGLEEFDRIQQEIQNAVKDLIPQISHNMGRAGMATGDLINTDCNECSLTSVVWHSKKNMEFLNLDSIVPSVEMVGRQMMSWNEQKELILVAVTQYICFCSTVRFVYFWAFSCVSYIM